MSFLKKIFFILPILILKSCFYTYFLDERELYIENEPEIDSLKKTFMSFCYSGKLINIRYKSDCKLPDTLVEQLAVKYCTNKEVMDSLNKEKIYFTQIKNGGGWTKKEELKCLHVADNQIVKIDTVLNDFKSDLSNDCMQMVLSVLESGNTNIFTNCYRKFPKIHIKVTDDSIKVEGDKRIRFKHQKSIFLLSK